jgi:aminopeptidase-like protein
MDLALVGNEMYQLITDLYPICRSITGNGFRETLGVLSGHIPLKTREIPSGKEVFDWVIPPEWNIRDAYIKNSSGKKVVDFRNSNLHVVGYSVPVKRTMRLEELKKHLFTLPEKPDWIPYRTSYYHTAWGFCLSHRQLQALKEDEYEVCIDSTLGPGHLTYGEFFLKGRSEEEVLISCHACHPSLCNDNLSGISIATMLARTLAKITLRYSYRFLFIPGTIGSIAWLSQNETHITNIKHGMVLTCLGDPGHLTYKKSRQGNAEIDQVFLHVLRDSGNVHDVIDFFPYGYDERQYCSPGFNLPVGCLMRTPHGRYPEYHTSADNLDLVEPAALANSLSICLRAVGILEANRYYLNRNPKCEPQLGKRGLYRAIGGQAESGVDQLSILWVLNLSDGFHSLLHISERSGISFATIQQTAELLECHALLEETQVGHGFRSPHQESI